MDEGWDGRDAVYEIGRCGSVGWPECVCRVVLRVCVVGVGKAMAEGGGVYSAQRWLKAYDELKCRWWILRVTTHAFTLAASRTATHTCAAAALLAGIQACAVTTAPTH